MAKEIFNDHHPQKTGHLRLRGRVEGDPKAIPTLHRRQKKGCAAKVLCFVWLVASCGCSAGAYEVCTKAILHLRCCASACRACVCAHLLCGLLLLLLLCDSQEKEEAEYIKSTTTTKHQLSNTKSRSSSPHFLPSCMFLFEGSVVVSAKNINLPGNLLVSALTSQQPLLPEHKRRQHQDLLACRTKSG